MPAEHVRRHSEAYLNTFEDNEKKLILGRRQGRLQSVLKAGGVLSSDAKAKKLADPTPTTGGLSSMIAAAYLADDHFKQSNPGEEDQVLGYSASDQILKKLDKRGAEADEQMRTSSRLDMEGNFRKREDREFSVLHHISKAHKESRESLNLTKAKATRSSPDPPPTKSPEAGNAGRPEAGPAGTDKMQRSGAEKKQAWRQRAAKGAAKRMSKKKKAGSELNPWTGEAGTEKEQDDMPPATPPQSDDVKKQTTKKKKEKTQKKKKKKQTKA